MDAILYAFSVRENGPHEPVFDRSVNAMFLGEQPLSVAVCSDRFKDREILKLSDLKNEYFVRFPKLYMSMIDKNDDREDYFEEACKKEGFIPKIIMCNSRTADIRKEAAVANKACFLSVVPEFMRDSDGVRYFRLSDVGYSFSYYLLSLKRNRKSSISLLSDFFFDSFSRVYKP